MRLPFQRPERSERAPDNAKRSAVDAAVDAIGAARAQARRRLIGAFVLLAIGVIGFPILFETQPRPLPAHTPIVTAQGEPLAAVVPPVPASRAMPARATTPPGEAPAAREAAAVSQAPAPIASAPASAPAAAPASASALAPRPVASAAALPAPPPPPPAMRPAAPKPAEPAAEEGRFVVQVGAFSDAATLREARHKVEKLGLKTYTQVIEGDAGKRTRVRVGPYPTRAEAQAAAAKLKAAGLPANLLTL